MAELSRGEGSSPGFTDSRLAQLEAENARLRAELAGRQDTIDSFPQAMLLEPQLRAVADALPQLIAYVDREQRYRYNNKAYEAWYGCPRSQLFGRHLRDALGSPAYERARPMIEAALSGKRVSAEISLPHPSGQVRYLHLEYVPRLGADDTVIGYFALLEDISERKRAEHVLRESEARFRAMADCAPCPVWVTGADGVEFVNKAFLDVAGRPAEEINGGTWARMIHSDDVDHVLQLRRQAWQAQAPYAYDARFRRGDGEWRWLHVSCNPRLDEDGRLTGYVGMAVDLTEQRRAEQELRESEARFRAIADCAPAPVWVTNSDGIEFANRELCAFTGLSEEALVGDAWIQLAHPDDVAEIRAQRARGWATRGPYAFEGRFRRHDGAWRRLQATCRPRDSGGEFVGYVGLAVDVTDSRRAEEELRASETMLRAIFDNAGVGMVLMDDQCRIAEANAAYGAIVRRDAESLLGGSCLDFTHPDDIPAQMAALAALRRGEGAPTFEKRYLAPDQAVSWVRVTLSTLDDRILAVVEDVTARRQAQEALSELNQSLEQRIASAIAEREHAEEALRQAQKMEAVGQLTGGIAHDFNNLLTVIGGNLDMASRWLGPECDSRVSRALGSARSGAERAATLTQRLLAFSRRQPLAPKLIDVNLLLAGMSDLLHRTLGETVEVETRLAAGPWRIEADPHQLESAVLNLAVNARDAMPDGGRLLIETAVVRVGAGELALLDAVVPGQYVMITVSDTGVGMNPETLKRAVEPFFTTKDVGKGTGLGLSMVYGFVRQSGGHMRIDSEEGSGTRIHVLLPRIAREKDEEEKTEVAVAPRSGGDETILVCEDDDDVRAYTVELLSELGYHVLEAHDGAATLRILGDPDAAVDLLFTDVVLPGGMSGAELARQARAARPGLKILYTSGYARDAIVHEGRLDPGVELVPKPFEFAGLASRLREVLDRG